MKKTFASLYDAVSSIYGYDGSTGGAANPSPCRSRTTTMDTDMAMTTVTGTTAASILG